MDNKQLANAYAIAKVLGYEKSVEIFKEELAKVYDETLKELNSKPIIPAKAEATKNPLRTNYQDFL